MSALPDRFERASQLLEEALGLPAEGRQEYLIMQCESDVELLALAERLLKLHEQAGDFLDGAAPLPATDLLPAATEEAPLTLLAQRYLLEAEIGRGATGVVWRATDQHLNNRLVAIKVLHAHWSGHGWMRFRLQDEMRALSKLHHPGIVAVIDYGELDDGRPFLVTELLDGITLRDRLSSGPIPKEESLAMIRQIAEGLDVAHASGILHRDLKPENLILCSGGGVKIVDFGIARIVEPDTASRSLTTFIAGTPAYMAPEQLRGRATRSSDIWSLAVVAFEMVTGCRPFEPATPFDLVELQRQGLPRKLLRNLQVRLPERAQAVFQKAFSQRETARPRTATAFYQALSSAVTSPGRLADRFNRRKILRYSASSLALGAGGWIVSERYLAWGRLPESERVIEWIAGTGQPISAGFTRVLDIRNEPILNANRTVRDRVRLLTRDQGYYSVETSVRQRRAAWRRGWRLHTQFAPQAGFVFVTVNLYGVGARYDLVAQRDAQGRVFAGVVHQMAPQVRWDAYETRLQPDGFLNAELRASPATHKAELSVNGITVASGYEGHRQYQINETLPQCGFCFGVLAQQDRQGAGLIKSVRFEIAG